MDSYENPAPAPPFVTYQYGYGGDIMADNINYVSKPTMQIELCTFKKDLASEKLLEDAFKSASLTYRKTEARIPGQKTYQVIYEIQLIGG